MRPPERLRDWFVYAAAVGAIGAAAAGYLVSDASSRVGPLIQTGDAHADTGVQAAPSREPHQLRGKPLGTTDLDLVVANTPPFVLTVDSGKVNLLPAIPANTRSIVWVVNVGGHAGVVVSKSGTSASVYSVRPPSGRVSFLGRGTKVWAAADSRSVWIQRTVNPSRCQLQRVALDGMQLRAPRPFPCATVTDPDGGALGLVVHRSRVIDPASGRTVLSTRSGIVAVGRDGVVALNGRRKLELITRGSRQPAELGWPSVLSTLDRPAVDPRGRFVALAFADPAWYGSSKQALDVWLLDTSAKTLTQLPGMPAFVSLKYTNMTWTSDGRLVLLAQSDGRDLVAVWRPGERRLRVAAVALPARNGVSDTFATSPATTR